MKHSFVVSLLLLSLFLTMAQGIRLEKGSFAAQQHKQHDQESNLLKTINSGNKEAIPCKDEQYCTGKIKNRKLVNTSASTTHDISKNVKNGGNAAQPPVHGNSRNDGEEDEIVVNKQQELPYEHYPDPVDIADMDYSPASRNPPIHN